MNKLQIGNQTRNTNPRRGGQASIGLFGCPGFNAPRQPLPRVPRASRIKGALNSFSSDGLSTAHYRKPAACIRRPGLADEPELAYGQWLADVAESYGCQYDEEAAAYACTFAGAGITEHLMAMEG